MKLCILGTTPGAQNRLERKESEKEKSDWGVRREKAGEKWDKWGREG